MRSRLPSWIVLVYLAIDLAHPFVPGAFQFTLEGGLVWVEGALHAPEGAWAGTSEVSGSTPPQRRPVPTAGVLPSGMPAPGHRFTSWLVRVRSGGPSSGDVLPSDAGDH